MARPHAVPVSRAAAGMRSAGTVRFERVAKTYRSAGGEVRALDDVSLDIPSGAIFGIIGRSGAGKSTLLRTVNRLEEPSSGRVLVDGEPIDGPRHGGPRRPATPDRHDLPALQPALGQDRVAERGAAAERWRGWQTREIARRVDEALRLVGLEGKAGTYPSRLSGGQKQRVGIARALVSEPEILLCDEATSALDPETTVSILGLLRDINRRLGLTIVLITHEMSVIREICTDVVVLESGRVVEVGPVWRVFGAPRASGDAGTARAPHPRRAGRSRRTPQAVSRPRPRAVLRITYSGGTPPTCLPSSRRRAGRCTSCRRAWSTSRGMPSAGCSSPPGGTEAEARLRAIGQDVEGIGYVAADD